MKGVKVSPSSRLYHIIAFGRLLHLLYGKTLDGHIKHKFDERELGLLGFKVTESYSRLAWADQCTRSASICWIRTTLMSLKEHSSWS